MSAARVLVAGPERAVRHLARTIALDARSEVVAVARDAAELVALARRHHPVVVLADGSLFGPRFSETAWVREASGAVLAVVEPMDPGAVSSLLSAGASGYVLADAPAEELARSVDAAASGVPVVRMEDVGHLVAELHAAREQIRLNEESKSSFLLALSHELRTPLTSVLGMAQTLERHLHRLDTAQAKELARRVVRGATDLNQTLTSLEHVERASASAWSGRRVATDLHAEARRVVAAVQRHGYDVTVDNGVFDAYVNPVHFELMLSHLVRNVVKHTPPGTHAWVRFVADEHGVEVAVDDDGPGVPDAAKDVIFNPFEQRGTPSHAPGVGIGLTVVGYLAAAAGGRAWVEDRPGGGASFKLFLPQRGVGREGIRPRRELRRA